MHHDLYHCVRAVAKCCSPFLGSLGGEAYSNNFCSRSVKHDRMIAMKKKLYACKVFYIWGKSDTID